VLIPANIRWHHYYKEEDVKTENKFAPIGVTLPLTTDLKVAAKKTKVATQTISNSFFEIYATYIMARVGGAILPNFIQKQQMNY
jgi:hypothetical protein